MDPEAFKEFLKGEVRRVLPHLDDFTLEEVIDFLVLKGCKKERDLRILTIPLLEKHLDLVDATDLFVEWQNKYGSVPKPSTSSASDSHPSESSTSRQALSDKQLNQQVLSKHFRMPVFDKESPYMPSGVKTAIENQRRPLAREREDMVQRMVDYCRETVPNLNRAMFIEVADNLVEMYPATFKDTLPINPKGSDSLRNQFKCKFDNDKRPQKLSTKENECPNIPAAYGCISWSPRMPDDESEDSLLQKKKNLQKMFKLTKKQWDWKVIKGHMNACFSLQRKDINGPEETHDMLGKKRKRSEAETADDPLPVKLTVTMIQKEWPFLFNARGMNLHFQQLTGIHFRDKFSSYIRQEGNVLTEFFAFKNENLAKIKRKMTRAQAKCCKSPTAAAVIQMIPVYFGEELKNMLTFVEATITTEEAQCTATFPDDGTPSIIAAGSNLYHAVEYFLTIDQQIVASTVDLEDAFSFFFCSYFVFNIQYSSKLERTLTFVQRAIANINPEKGSKTHATAAAAQRRLNQKVLKLSNDYEDYKSKVSEEENEDKENCESSDEQST